MANNGKLRQTWPLVVLLLILLLPGTAFAFMGPLDVRNSFPMVQAVGNPSIESARPENAVEAHLSYSSVFVNDSSSTWSFVADFEAAVLDLRLRRLVGDSWELSLDVPVISYHSGFMDGFLDAYHDAFGLPDYGRGSRPSNEFAFLVSRDGATVVEGNAGRISLGDIKVGLKKALHGKDPRISVYGFVELPSGDASSGFGSGSVDGGAAVLLDKSIGEKTMLYLNAGFVFAHSYRAAQTVGLESFPYGGAALEWAVSGKVSLLAQFFAQGSPFRDTGIRAIDAISTTLSFGAKFRTGPNSILEFTFTEDTNTAGAPDVMFSTGFSYAF